MRKPHIHFYSPSAFEPWDWRNPDTVGIGGSETSHIQMALRLASRGWTVTSYSPLPTDCPNTFHGGVHWRDLSEADFSQPGLWVLYRCPEVCDRFTAGRLDQQLWLVCQDEDYATAWWQSLGNADELVYARQDKLHRVLALCNAHAEALKRRYPRMASKVVVSSNGLRRELVEEVLAGLDGAPPHPHRMMYASSPDRALTPVLKVFDRVREQIPDAELWVCYGFDNMEKIVKRIQAQPEQERDPGDVRYCKWVDWLKTQLEKPGVTHFGRMPQRDLLELWGQCGLWVYPVRFRETNCITSMEAQAMGAIPITCPIWAVGENVHYGEFIDEALDPDRAPGNHVSDPLTLDRFVHAVVEWMRNPARQEAVRSEMMAWAADWFDYNRVVDQWERWIRN